MARDYAARCPVYPMRNAWLVAVAVLLAAQGKCERAQLCFLQWKSRQFFAWCSLNVATPGTFPAGQPAFPECWMFDGVTSPRPLWLLLRAPRPIVKVYCPSSTSDLCVHVCVLSFGKPRREVWLSWFAVFVLIPRRFRRQVTVQET